MGEGLVEEGAGGSRMIHEWRRVNDGGRRWERGEVGYTGLQKTEGWKELKGSGISIYLSIYLYIPDQIESFAPCGARTASRLDPGSYCF